MPVFAIAHATKPSGGEWLAWTLLIGLGAWTLTGVLGLTPPQAMVSVGSALLGWVVLMASLHRSVSVWGGASRLTSVRAMITLWLGGLLWVPTVFDTHGFLLALIALAALLLDGVDGWWARRFEQMSAVGARFDMETDAALILVLSVALWLIDRLGVWVLAMGLMRYGFVAAQQVWPWLRGQLPLSYRRKVICVVQVSVLLLVMPPWLSDQQSAWLVATGLAFLIYSFAVDTLYLWRAHQQVR